MKKLINAIRDFIYNITDYGLIITVIVVMAAVLGWRFDILFNRTIDKEVMANLPETIIAENDTPINTDIPDQIVDNTEENNETNNETAGNETAGNETEVIATIEIPEGSFPSNIGEILVESNLINNKEEFLNKSVELGLDTRLQSGTFEIEVGTSIDNIVKIIARAN